MESLKSFSLTAVLILIATCAMAASAPNDADGFKDYKFGMTKPEIESIAKQRQGKYTFLGPEEKIGDITVNPDFKYETGADGVERLGEVYFLIQTNEFLIIKAAFLERYGKPTSSSIVTFRNGFGAQFKGEILDWKGTRSAITIMEIVTGKYGSVSLRTQTFDKNSTAKNTEALKKAAKDL